ncbi:hypothetical protein BCR37DRAFT_388110 [Protomyces lactucae-debilis]|uniref:C2H2-type domain-containing protein n=1 Tax=Protomyces lactucae-debilis TaxID=2754530 RepID=A0A1Y2FAK7_PROLT|nr:uncharacterized protein BCR37DRAFT_388110 [Protomyces lactucae-debilis]ORY80376.1 hypothetical protein BCR37DRAFT_388110 [Protomyces lactucae-debilis]
MSKLNFTCDLCRKSYARIHDLDAHLSSFDHLHNERRKTLRQVHSRTAPSTSSQDDGMLKVLSVTPAPAAKKHKSGGFKSAFGLTSRPRSTTPETTAQEDTSGLYDPRFPTMGWD